MHQLRSERDVFIEPPLPVLLNGRTRSTGQDESPSSEEPSFIAPGEEPEPQQRIYFGPFWHAENGSARILRTLLRSHTKLPPVSQRNWDAVFHYLAENRNMLLTEKQRQSVQMAYYSNVSHLTRGTGTDKSTSNHA